MLAPLRTLVHFLLAAIQFFLGMHFFLRLLGANPRTPFVAWIYETSAPLLAPFQNMFPVGRVEGVAFDFTTLFALFFYVFAGYVVFQTLLFLESRAR
jgi:uncharacterized protein YggT (Ycf19 family)